MNGLSIIWIQYQFLTFKTSQVLVDVPEIQWAHLKVYWMKQTNKREDTHYVSRILISNKSPLFFAWVSTPQYVVSSFSWGWHRLTWEPIKSVVVSVLSPSRLSHQLQWRSILKSLQPSRRGTICPESPRAGDKPKCFVRCLVWDRLPMADWWSQEGKLNELRPKSPHFTPSGGSSCCLRNLQFTRFYIKAHHNSHTFYCFVEANTKRSLNFVALVELLRGSQKDLEG